MIALIDSAGNVVVQYAYDAWGNHAVLNAGGEDITDPAHIGNVNPIRYRGYYYDGETDLYYLQTRYYDPTTGRFVTIDGIEYADPETLNGLNLYAYCGNNPVMNVDPTGTVFWLIPILIGAVVGALVGAGSSIISQGLTKGWGNIDWGQVLISGLSGMLIGAIMASPLGPVATGIGVGVISFAESVISDAYANDWDFGKVNWGNALASGILSGLTAGFQKFIVDGIERSFAMIIKGYDGMAKSSFPTVRMIVTFLLIAKKVLTGIVELILDGLQLIIEKLFD